jgi:hypothetical protein
MRIITGCACAGAIALVGAGCGSSSSSSNSSGLSKAQLAAAVNPLCTNFVAQGKTIPPPANNATPQELGAYLDKLIAFANTLSASIQALKPADSVKADFNAYVQSFSSNITTLKSAATKFSAGDRSGVDLLNQENAADHTVTRPLEQKLGFTACESKA